MINAQPIASHFIDGKYVESDGDLIEVTYPFTGEVIARLHAATPEIVNHAIESATRAQSEWATRTPVERARILQRAVAIIRDRADELAQLETLDTGKPIQETEVADWPSGADSLEYFAGLAPAITGDSIPLGGDFAYTIREPLGVCVGIGAWNYPSQIACWKAGPALSTGNTMVFKPSEVTPLGALKLAEIFIQAGMPPGVFNVVQGYGSVGAALSTDPRVAKVSLTGSVPTGTKVYTAAAAGMKQATMELGGKSPLIIFDDASLDDAVGAAMLGNFYSSGQICSNGTRVFVQNSIRKAFLERLSERAARIVKGDPLLPETQFGPLINHTQFDQVMGYIEIAKKEGASLVCGGMKGEEGSLFVQPTIFADVTDHMTIAREEIFGPVMSVLDFETEEEVITRANDCKFGLAAGVFTKDLARAHRVVGSLQAGTCWINSYNLTPVEMPFGPVKASGFGRENSRAAIEHYTQVKSVYVGMTPVDSPY